MRDWMDVAVLAKCKNKEGRFAVQAAAGLPFMLDAGCEVAFVPPRTDLPRRAVVAEACELGPGRAELRFEGIEGEAARAMVGMHCLMRRDQMDDSVLGESPGAWDGWKVVDEELGEIGSVSGLIENPAQALLEVAVPGRPDAVLVPVVDEIVRDVDVEECTVLVALPTGLMDI